jgi:uncharacterized protein YjbJ (UPF0337 family)
MRGNAMNWERIQGSWKQLTGKAKEQWGKLTSDDWDVVAGRRDQFAGKVQERYGLAKDEAEMKVAQCHRRLVRQGQDGSIGAWRLCHRRVGNGR